MKTEHINELISHPEKVSADDLRGLQQLVLDHPWCQSFQILYAKALKADDNPGFNKQLKKTAIYAADRKVLYRLIMQPVLQQSIEHFESMVAASDSTASEPSTTSPTLPELTSEDKEREEAVEQAPTEKEPTNDLNPIIPTTEPVAASTESDQLPTPKENEASESDTYEIDSTNLEQEVLKEVAARAFELQFESQVNSPADFKTEAPEKEVSAAKPTPPRTFLEFITQHSSTHPLPPETRTEEPANINVETSLIDRFIQNEPKIERKKASFFSPVNMGKMSIVDNEEIVSETLATIYAKQGDIEKAKKAYRQLALKFPEKSIYFAGLIKKLEQSPK